MTSSAAPTAPLGVGFLGAGPVTQAIHLPALARLTDTLRVQHIMDVDPAVAASVASRAAAAHSSSMEELLADPAVEIVAICSPHQFHAEQVIAACRAGKKAILCEKPFAMNVDEAKKIAAVSAETGVPIIVGAMHTFDPGWLAATESWGSAEHWEGLLTDAHTIRSSIVLPPNPRFEDFATEVRDRPAGNSSNNQATTAQLAAAEELAQLQKVLRDGVMGLAIHDLPLVRRFTPDFENIQVLQAKRVKPFGYVISLQAGTRTIELRAAMNSTWKPEWNFEAISDDAALRIDFTPSYVQAGSAVATISSGTETRSYGPYAYNGYEGEWRELAAIAAGSKKAPDAQSLIHDLTFAISIADAAVELAGAAS
ncbi:Gfo/Idh/MocA family protein [Pseudarthrobacter sp. J1763]|uniref:Gfo/Idh/MocA family protein n=1 Tax=Pseudarthrobacter sp. J1763 TaxID=3420445 RepID=UPI003D2E5273